MIVTEEYRNTVLDIWAPKYSAQYGQYGGGSEPVVLLSKRKVDHSSSLIIIKFTKAKHLMGQRYCIFKSKAQSYPVDSNGKIECYAVPMSALDTWEKQSEQ